ncbi:phosphatase PAP2 family protein [Nocardioides sp.]|uniref:phosphatase PAP2 family protein n=1 Tax=Nocardioides sp. TaxID=35761 RepID=UPI0039E33D1C
MSSIPADEVLPEKLPDGTPDGPVERARARYGFVAGIWLLVLAFAAVAVVWSQHVDVGFKDPGGRMLRGKLATAAVGLVIALAIDVAWRSWRTGSLRATLRQRLCVERLTLLVTGLLAYHLVYFCYRNLKSWDAFNTPRDDWLLRLDRDLFGQSPAVLLHDLLGRDEAAYVLMVVYKSFTYLVPISLIGALVLSDTIKRGYVFLAAAMWTWVLGTASYYLIPSLGPFASAPEEFAGLPHTPITDTWAEYLQQRQDFLADPQAPDSFVSISAFASLHTGFTCLVVLMAFYYGHRRLGTVLALYLVAIMVSTVYWGWHFTLDDVGGIVLAAAAVGLGHLTVRRLR